MSHFILKNISKKYGSHEILKDVSIEVERGELISIFGESGCGKSTLLNIIGLLESYDSGDYSINDIKNPALNKKEALLLRRNEIGYLFQNFALVENYTVRENLEIAMSYSKLSKSRKKKEKIEALRKVNLEDKINSYIYELSGGEQQRISIARLLLKPFNILLADEPTGSLDKNNRDLILSILKEINNEGKTILIVTHDSKVRDFCDRCIYLTKN